MIRQINTQRKCPACSRSLAIDEPMSLRKGRLLYRCAGCGEHFSVGEEDLRSAQGQSATGDGTVRMRRVKPAGKSSKSLGTEALPEGMTLSLEVTDGPATGRIYQPRTCLVQIGRDKGTIQIADPTISRLHASLEIHDADTMILRDLSSTNGTYLNRSLIAFSKVQDGDEIRLGSTAFVVAVDFLSGESTR